MRTFRVLLHHRRLPAPALHLVAAEDASTARLIADELLQESPDHVGVEVWGATRRLYASGAVRIPR